MIGCESLVRVWCLINPEKYFRFTREQTELSSVVWDALANPLELSSRQEFWAW